jgi:basic membrane protein A
MVKKVFFSVLYFSFLFLFVGCQGSSVTYKVDFYVDNEIYLQGVLVEEGEFLTEPPTPQKEGHEFVGWYFDESLDQNYSSTEAVNQDMDLYGHFSPLSYSLSYEVNGGTELPSRSLTFDSLISDESTQREGHTFVGWFLDEALSQEMNLTHMPARDLILYAKWEVNSYALSFVDHNGDVLWTEDYLYQADLSEVELPQAPTRQGYVFDGWSTDLPANMPGNDLIIQPSWTRLGTQIALITDSGQVDDQAYNQSAWEGVVEYGEAFGMTYGYYVPNQATEEDILASIDMAVEEGAMVIVCPGYIFQSVVYHAQMHHPNVAFLLLDATPFDPDEMDEMTNDNTHNILYKEEEAGFLAGYSAVMEGYTQLGFIGGFEIPPIQRYGYGFIQGAEYAANRLGLEPGSIELLYNYSGSFFTNASLQNRAESWYENGTEVIFSVTGGGLASVVSASEKYPSSRVIGVDVDQVSFSDQFLTSAIKHIGASVYKSLFMLMNNDGLWPDDMAGQTFRFGVADNGVGLPTKDESWRFQEFSVSDYLEIISLISNGSVLISDTIDQMPETTIVSVSVIE